MISIHAPREGSDSSGHMYYGTIALLFLSTLPARGATDVLQAGWLLHGISIHAPREGSDKPIEAYRGMTYYISIHAPREGSDAAPCSGQARPGHFYPRSPRGERLHHHLQQCLLLLFLSTLPARGATAGIYFQVTA